MIDGLKKKSMRRLSTISSFTASYDLLRKNYLRRKLAMIRSANDGIECGENHEIPIPKPSWRNFDFAELLRLLQTILALVKHFPLYFYSRFSDSDRSLNRKREKFKIFEVELRSN